MTLFGKRPDPLAGLGALSVQLRRQQIWAKGRVIAGRDPHLWRADDFGTLMNYHAYGDRSSEHGWEEDHIVAVALGGTGDVSNMRPLHWRNNAKLGGMLSDLLQNMRR